MVAKINRGVSLYGAIAYNQQKVGDSHARIISGNRMIADITDSPERLMQRTMWAFESYLLANRNTEKPILHISLNPSPEDKLTDAQFANLAKEYMDKMGYGDQPYIVYMHEDIGRRHIHIVSTCVNEKGEKIDDAYEWNRSMKACRELERKFGLKQHADKKDEQLGIYLKKADYTQGDLKRQVSNILKSVFTAYRFQTFGEYSALLSCFNIEAKQVKGEHGGVPYTGIVYAVTDDNGKAVSAPIKSSLIDKRFGYQGVEKRLRYNAGEFKAKKWQPKIRNEVALAMHGCMGSKEAVPLSGRCRPAASPPVRRGYAVAQLWRHGEFHRAGLRHVFFRCQRSRRARGSPRADAAKEEKEKTPFTRPFITRLFIQLKPYDYATRRRHSRIGQDNGVHAGRIHPVFSDSCVLVLLSGIFRHGYLHRNCG